MYRNSLPHTCNTPHVRNKPSCIGAITITSHTRTNERMNEDAAVDRHSSLHVILNSRARYRINNVIYSNTNCTQIASEAACSLATAPRARELSGLIACSARILCRALSVSLELALVLVLPLQHLLPCPFEKLCVTHNPGPCGGEEGD